MTENRNYTMDTGALFLYFAGGSRGEKVKPYFAEVLSGKAKGIISEVTLAESFYKICQSMGIDVARVRDKIIRRSRFRIVPPDETLSTFAGQLKCKYGDKISLADAFAAASAQVTKSKLVTTDEELARISEIESLLLKFKP